MRIATFGLGLAALSVMSVSSPANAVVNLVKNGDFSTVTNAVVTTCNSKGKKCSTQTYNNFEFGASFPTGSSTGTNRKLTTAGSVAFWTSPVAAANNFLFDAATATTAAAVNRYNDPLAKIAPGSNHPGDHLFQASPTGGDFVAIDGDQSVRNGQPIASGPIQQQISGLIVGHVYKLSFDWAAGQLQNRVGSISEKFQVSLGNQTQTTNTLVIQSQGFSGWLHQTFNFKATSGQELLSFLSRGCAMQGGCTGPNGGLPPVALLDGVVLQDTGATPEPATWLMMILGMGCVGSAARIRRRAGA